MRKSTSSEKVLLRSVFSPQSDRRNVRRMSMKLHQGLPVAVRCGQGTVCQGRVLNLSVQGMLVEFPNGQIPPVPMNAKVSVKLHYPGDSIWLPGLVRHRNGRKMGFLFPSLLKHPTRASKHPLTVVLHSLSHVIASA